MATETKDNLVLKMQMHVNVLYVWHAYSFKWIHKLKKCLNVFRIFVVVLVNKDELLLFYCEYCVLFILWIIIIVSNTIYRFLVLPKIIFMFRYLFFFCFIKSLQNSKGKFIWGVQVCCQKCSSIMIGPLSQAHIWLIKVCSVLL